MALFPSPHERNVASALLLLSKTEPHSLSPSSPRFGPVQLKERIASKRSSEESFSLVSSGSKSESSSLTGDASSKEIRAAHKLRIFAAVARCHEIKFKVVRKRRSQVCCSSSDEQKIVLALPATESSRSESTEASCLSSTSSAASTARSRYVTRGMARDQMEVPRNPKRSETDSNHGSSSSGSAHMRRKAEAILKLLSRGSSSEVRIRQQLGDSPDTSKALRMLLKQEEIKRSGAGGRLDPYIYKIA